MLHLFSFQELLANNLNISNVSLAEQDSATDRAKIQFDISWDNSWRNQSNWDAVWIFMKYTTETSAPYTWRHATLYISQAATETNNASYSRGSGTTLDIVVPYPAAGAFVYRSSVGYGSVSTTSMKFVWNYGIDVTEGDIRIVNDQTPVLVKVYGIEMVYIPQDTFFLGDATASSSNPAGGFFRADDTTNYTAFTVSTDSGIELGGTNSAYVMSRTGMTVADDFTSVTTQTLPAAYPTGYNAFYVMKYEITQNQYTEFLNRIDRSGQGNRVAATVTGDSIPNFYVMSAESQLSRSNRNTIQALSVGNGSVNEITFSVTRPYRAMNYMNWMDLTAYADWSGLRPMSELEYEKVSRGPARAHSGEYAWGSTALTLAATISGTEDGTETISTTNANVNYGNGTFGGGDSSTGPLRSGIFATTSARATRQLTGAGFYGVMELSGNVTEQVATVGNSTLSKVIGGRGFDGSAHGDGIMQAGNGFGSCTSLGSAVQSTWPGASTAKSGEAGCTAEMGLIVKPYGSIRRGGGWSSESVRLRVSDRYDSASVIGASRDSAQGGRLARTAP